MRGVSVVIVLMAALSAAACSSVSSLMPNMSGPTEPAGSMPAPAGGQTTPGLTPQGTTPLEPAGATPGTGAFDAADYNCPEVTVRSGTSTLMLNDNKPAQPGEANPMGLRFQGNLVRFSRECQPRPGTMTMRVGIMGRVITGPAGTEGGNVDLPIRMAVVEEGPNPKTVVSKLIRIPVSMPPNSQFQDFEHVESELVFPIPRVATDLSQYVVYVGFDPSAAQPARKPAVSTRRNRR